MTCNTQSTPLMKAHETGQAFNVESRHRRADGIYRWFNVLGFALARY